MGKERESVVDSWGRHHQLKNLHVLDGSLFPTSLGVNPQETIYGLVSLLTDTMLANGDLNGI